jgi:polar amino acid transport system substrate-binding protein
MKHALFALTIAFVVALLPGLAAGQDAEVPAESLTVVMTDSEPFVTNDDGRADGFYAEIWNDVARDLGVNYDVIWVDSFSALLETVAAGDADVAVAPLTPTAEREALFDFSSAVIGSGPQLGYHERNEGTTSIIRAFLNRQVLFILLVAVVALVIIGHVMWFAERNLHEEDGDFDRNYFEGIWDGLWWSTVTATTVGYGDKTPKSRTGRALALVTMMLSLFLVGGLVSQVTTVLSANRVVEPFDSIETLGETTVGVVEGTSFAAYVEAEGAQVRAYPSQTAVFEAAAAGEVDAVVGNPFALTVVGPRYGIVSTGEVLYEEFETFGLAQDSAWREPINQALARLQASGEVQEIVTRWVD